MKGKKERGEKKRKGGEKKTKGGKKERKKKRIERKKEFHSRARTCELYSQLSLATAWIANFDFDDLTVAALAPPNIPKRPSSMQ